MRRLLLLAALAAPLVGCAYTVFPVLPAPVELGPRLVVGPGSSFARVGPEIVLRLELREVPSEDYLSVFLYRADAKVAENSQLVSKASTSAEFRFSPAEIGVYRAVVFWGGRTARQFELEVQ